MIILAAIGHAYLISVYVIWLEPDVVFKLVENKASCYDLAKQLSHYLYFFFFLRLTTQERV